MGIPHPRLVVSRSAEILKSSMAKTNHHHVRVLWERDAYEPGDAVRARVLLSLAREVDGAVLTAALQCEEGVEYRDIDAVRNAFHHSLHQETLALTRVNSRFVCGDHGYDVEWRLPETMPPHTTVQFQLGTVRIFSSIRVILQRAGTQRADLDVVLPLPLRVPTGKQVRVHRHVRGASISATRTRELKSFGLFKQGGSCRIDATMDMNVIDRHGPVSMNVALHKDSKQEFQMLKVDLMRCERLQTPLHGMSIRCYAWRWDCTPDLLAAVKASVETNPVVVTLSLAASDVDTRGAELEWHFLKASFVVVVTCTLSKGAQVEVELPVVVKDL